MAIQKFEDIIVWQKAQDFSVSIYNEFKNNKDYSFNEIARMIFGLIKSLK